jgi:hypothetical protein
MIYSHNTDFLPYQIAFQNSFNILQYALNATCHIIASVLLSSKTMWIIIVILAKSQLCQIGSQLMMIHSIPIFN